MTATTAMYTSVPLVTLGLAAYLLLRRRASGPNDKPAKDSPAEKLGEGIHLRDLFRLAVMIEEEGMAFYEKMADIADSPATKELCAKLAGEEAGHRKIFQDRLDSWRPLPPNHLHWPEFLKNVEKEGFFRNSPGEWTGEKEMAAFAIRQEIKTAEFYAMFEQSFPEAWKREQIRDLALEERLHEQRLRAAYPDIKI